MSDVKHRLFVDRSEVLIKCLPESPYRYQVEYLHKDMLEYITKLTEQIAESQRQNRELRAGLERISNMRAPVFGGFVNAFDNAKRCARDALDKALAGKE